MREATSPKPRRLREVQFKDHQAHNNQAALHNTCRTKGIISEVSDLNGVNN